MRNKRSKQMVDEWRAPLTSLAETARTVTRRMEIVRHLEKILFDEDAAPDVLALAHMSEIIGAEPWLFGEEYALHVSDNTLTALLEAHLGVLGSSLVRGFDGRARRGGFMFGRSMEFNSGRRGHLVVEIMRPTVSVTRREISRIEDYARAVAADSRFDSMTTRWDFVVVATRLDGYAAERAAQPNRAPGLVFESSDSRVRVWARCWNPVINDAKHRLKFVRARLEHDPDADGAASCLFENCPAEGGGFEPPEPVKAQRFSRPPQSSALPSLP